MKKILLTMGVAVLAGSAFAQQWISTNGQKHVMLYEGSGAWCMHCSDGAVYVEKNLTTFGDKLVAISVHNRDGMSTIDGNVLDASLSNGWPWGSVDMQFFNALKKQNTPQANWGDTVNISLNRGFWELAITERLAVAPKFDIMMHHSFDKTTRELTVNVEVKALEDATGNYNVNVFLTEDKVVGPDNSQYNQANSITHYNTKAGHPLFGKNNSADGKSIVGWEHNHTVRASLGGPWGVQGPNNVKKGDVFKHEFKFTIPQKMGATTADELTVNLNNMHLAAVVHGRVSSTGTVKNPKGAEVDNALGAKMFPWNPNDVENLSHVAQVQILPNPAGSVFMVKAYLSTSAAAELKIVNLVGQTVVSKSYPNNGDVISDMISTENLSNGVYLLSITSNGEVKTQRLVVSK